MSVRKKNYQCTPAIRRGAAAALVSFWAAIIPAPAAAESKDLQVALRLADFLRSADAATCEGRLLRVQVDVRGKSRTVEIFRLND